METIVRFFGWVAYLCAIVSGFFLAVGLALVWVGSEAQPEVAANMITWARQNVLVIIVDPAWLAVEHFGTMFAFWRASVALWLVSLIAYPFARALQENPGGCLGLLLLCGGTLFGVGWLAAPVSETLPIAGPVFGTVNRFLSSGGIWWIAGIFGFGVLVWIVIAATSGSSDYGFTDDLPGPEEDLLPPERSIIDRAEDRTGYRRDGRGPRDPDTR